MISIQHAMYIDEIQHLSFEVILYYPVIKSIPGEGISIHVAKTYVESKTFVLTRADRVNIAEFLFEREGFERPHFRSIP